jgi:hypothetical protein
MTHRNTIYWAAGAIFGLLATADMAHADDGAGCSDPAWARPALAGFAISDCTDKPWATVDVDLPAGSRTLGGHRTTVEYAHVDGAKDVSAAAVKSYQIQQAEKAGAELVSDATDSFKAVLTAKGPQGEFWYIYDHGDGSDDATGSYTLTTVAIEPLDQDVHAKAMVAPLDVSAKGCANPPWLVSQFTFYKVESCDKKAYATADYDLADSSKTLAGKRLSVTYALTDAKRDPVALAVRNNYVSALEAIGARLVSSPTNAYQAILTQTTANGETWYIYDHGAGNDDSTESYTLTTYQIAPFEQVVQAQPIKAPLDTQAKTCAGPPWLVKQFDYFKAADCDNRDFDAVKLTLADGDKVVAGRVLETDYALTDEVRNPTAQFVRTNYVNALQGIGATLMSDPDGGFDAVLKQTTPLGDFWYVYAHGAGSADETDGYRLTTIQVGGPPPTDCTLVVYGIQFDFDKAVLRPDSEPVLEQLLAMFTSDPSYAGEIGGHTDNVGKAAYNLTLSAARADAVKTWLVAQGVDAARLTTHGYGDTVPIVPNTTDANRARNRRVELKKNECK